MRKLSKLGLLILCVPLLTAADIYRWVDPDGVVNYTQLKPEGVPAQQLSTRDGRPTVVSQAPDRPAATPEASDDSDKKAKLTPEQRAMLDDLQAKEQARKDQVAKIKEANCEKSRAVLRRLSATGRIRVRDDAGNERVMGEDERQRRIDDAQQGIVENCTDSAAGA